MTFRKIVIFSILLLLPLLATQTVFAQLGNNQGSLAKLFSNSKMLVKCEVVQTNSTDDDFTMNVQVNTVLFGQNADPEITIQSQKKNGRFMNEQAYLGKGDEYLLFVSESEKGFVITSGAAGVFHPDYEEDLTAIAAGFSGDANLFDKAAKETLQSIFRGMKTSLVKLMVLSDLSASLTSADQSFISELLQSDDVSVQKRGLAIAGKNKAEGNRIEIETLAANSDNKSIVHYAVHALGEIRSAESVPVIVEMLNHPELIVRKAAVLAYGKTGPEGISDILKEQYARESDLFIKLRIIDVLGMDKDKSRALAALTAIAAAETNDTAAGAIDFRMKKLK